MRVEGKWGRLAIAASIALFASGYGSCGSSLGFRDADGDALRTVVLAPGEERAITATIFTDIHEPTVVLAATVSDAAVVEVLAIAGARFDLHAIEEGASTVEIRADTTYGDAPETYPQTLRVIVTRPPETPSLTGVWRERDALDAPRWIELTADGRFALSRGESRPALDECTGTWQLEGNGVAIEVGDPPERTRTEVALLDDGLLLTRLAACGRYADLDVLFDRVSP